MGKTISQIEFESDSNSKKYKVKEIYDWAIYVKKLEREDLLDLYYLILWKGYLKKENIWKPILAVLNL